MSGCLACGSDRMKTTPSGRTYCIPCRLAHEKRRKTRPAPSGEAAEPTTTKAVQ